MIDLLAAGLAGDGVVDDQPVLEALVSGGGWFELPGPRTYAMHDYLRLRSNTRLTLGPGARLLKKHGASLIVNGWPDEPHAAYTGEGNITIDGPGILDCNGGEIASSSSAIAIGHSHDVTIKDITIKDVYGYHGLECNSSRDVKVEGVKFASYFNPDGNTQKEAVQLDVASEVGLGGAGAFDLTPCLNVRVCGCTFGRSDTPGSVAWPRGVGSHGYPEGTPRHSRIKVDFNTFEETTAAAIQTYWWENFQIIGNQIANSGASAITVKDSSRFGLVAHNQIQNTNNTAIWINNACSDIDVLDNEAYGYSRGTNNADYGIRVSGGCATVHIADNKLRNYASGNRGKFGISIASGQTEISTRDNKLAWSGIGTGASSGYPGLDDDNVPVGNHAGNILA